MSVRRLVPAVFFIAAGTLRFVRPRACGKIVPPDLPASRALVLTSGAAGVTGGEGALAPRLRRASGWGLLALLVAVFPANVLMALYPEDVPGLSIPRLLLWLRLPPQPLMMAWVWCVPLRR